MRFTILEFEVHSTLLPIGTVLYVHQISRIYASSISETLNPLYNNSPLSPSPIAGNHYCTLSFSDFDCFIYLISVESFNICLSMSGWFHLAEFIHVVKNGRILFFFLRQNNIPLHAYTTFFIQDTWAVFIPWHLWIVLQWT